MKSKLSIGEMSKLHNMSVKTLRYYDEIGLFKPIEVDANTGYRYYSIEQFEKLSTIYYLKKLGIPLIEIKKHFNVTDIDCFLDILKTEKEITEQKIAEYKERSEMINKRINEITDAREIVDIEKVRIEQFEKTKIVALKEDILSVEQMELCIRKLANKHNMVESAIIGRVGMTISKNNILNNNYSEYSSIYMFVDDDREEGIDYLKSGQYATLYYRGGNHKDSPIWYEFMKNYILKHDYEIYGDAIERVIVDQYISKNKNDYLTEIKIPIKKI